MWNGTERTQKSDQTEVDWKNVVEQIRAGDPAGDETLYRNLAGGARLFLQRRLATQDVEDRIHDLFVIVIETIRRGALREPERLMGFVRTVLNRQLNREISRIIHVRQNSIDLDSAADLTTHEPSPEQQAVMHQKVALMRQVLRRMSNREFEVLTRFYLREQPPERIRLDMGLTQTQFSLLKSRAKTKLTELMQQKLAKNPLSRE